MAKATKNKSLEAPFDAALWRRATKSAEKYSVLVQAVGDRFIARCVEMPGVTALGATSDEALQALREPLTVAIATLLESDRKVPAPAGEGKRESQVNVKLTAEERIIVEEASKREGFRGLSDYFRHAALRLAGA
jgi:predicted RNase H-like HicB family nuclease